MKLVAVGPEEPLLQSEDVWFGSNRLRTSKAGEVLWTRGSSTVFRRFARTFPGTKPPQSIFATFEGVLCACTLSNELILVNGENGTFWDISLPFAARKIWANPLGGFYVSRYQSKSIQDPSEPVLFTITHPLDEPKPVDLPPNEDLVAAIRTTPFFITYSPSEAKHSLWRVSAEEKAPAAQVVDIESSAFIIESEVKLNLVRSFTSKEWPGKLSKAFVSSDPQGNPILCVLLPSTKMLYCASLSDSKEADSRIDDVLDATTITGSTKASLQDVVVLKGDGSLHLYRGPFHLAPLVLPLDRTLSRLQRSSSSDQCFDVVINNRSRLRVGVPAKSDGPDAGIIDVLLRAADKADATFGLAIRVDVMLHSKGSERFKTLKDIIFDLLQDAVKCKASDERVPTPATYFEKLLRSPFHADRTTLEGQWLFGNASESIKSQASKTTRFKSMANLLSKQVLSGGKAGRILIQWIRVGHLAFEDMRLNRLDVDTSLRTAQFLAGLLRACFGGSSTTFRGYYDHYWREFQPFQMDDFGEPEAPLIESGELLPHVDVMASLMHALQTGEIGDLTGWNGISRAGSLLRVFSLIHFRDDLGALQVLVEGARLDLSQVETLPVGVQIVVRELLHRCRASPPAGLSREACILIEREDVHASLVPEAFSESHEDDLWIAWAGEASTSSPSQGRPIKGNETISVFKHLLSGTRLRFSRDQRVKEVTRLLDSSTPLPLIVKRTPVMTDHDLVEAQQRKLKRQVLWAMAGTAGRGALMLFTTPVGEQEKTVRVPNLAKSGKLPPQQIEIKLDEASAINSAWPAFHNGVAAGLARALRPQSATSTTQSAAVRDMLRSWILFNKPKPLTDEHAGIVLALGLNRDLASLTVPDTYEYVGPRHLTTSIATLLGLACAKAGTCDASVRKTLTLHLPSLYPQEISDADLVPTIVRSSALLGLGMLYRGTCNRLMCEFFLEEISKSPQSSLTVDERESYSLSAGLSLGLVALGYGRVEGGLAGLLDLELEDKLQLLISGGPVEKLTRPFAASANGGDAAGERNTIAARQQRMSGRGGPSPDRTGLPGGPGAAEREPKCSRVLEGTHVNTDVTAPGATLALGLIYIKSNDLSVAQRLGPPSTRVLLESIRPDLLMFRAWASALILWNSVEPTMDWICRTLPSYLLSVTDFQDVKLHAQARGYLVAGAALGLGCCFAGTGNSHARDVLCNLYTLAGASSSAESESDNAAASGLHAGFLDHVGWLCSDTALSCLALALGMVMAGTGDLETLKTLRAFRRGARRYGAQQLSGLALGFLFLGGGSMSFARSDEAIAALVCSVFPVLARTADDNAAYVQALRHLYVLASERRSVEAVDADTQQAAILPLLVRLKRPIALDEASLSAVPDLEDTGQALFGDQLHQGGDAVSTIRVVAPCWLPPAEFIESITLASPRYWGLSLPLRRLPLRLVVKLRADQLPYQVDPRGLSSLTARPRPRSAAELVGSLRDFASKTPFVLAFAKHVPGQFELVYEGLVRDCLNLLPSLIEIASCSGGEDRISPQLAGQIHFLRRFYASPVGQQSRLVWDRLLLLEANLNASILKRYVREGPSVGLGSSDAKLQTKLNLCGIPRFGAMDGWRRDEASMIATMAVSDPESALELLEANTL